MPMLQRRDSCERLAAKTHSRRDDVPAGEGVRTAPKHTAWTGTYGKQL